jgi:dihydropteroate synthase
VRSLEIRSIERAEAEMRRIGADPAGVRIMAPKAIHYNLKAEGLTPAQANVIKQEMLSAGGEAAVARGAASCSVDSSGAVISGTLRQFDILREKLRVQAFGLPEVAASIGEVLDNIRPGRPALRGRTMDLSPGERTLVMGILNVTPDSFSDGGLYLDWRSAVERGRRMAAEGADIVDVGGESTRPGAAPVPVEDELKRVVPVVEALSGEGVAVSVDTRKAAVARAALDAGAEMVNDVSALGDPGMARVCADSGAAVILMHMRGTPETMQRDLVYENVTEEVFAYLAGRLEYALASGMGRDSTVIDPGIGFGKSAEGNMELIANLAEFRALGRPVLLGPSRKSFIGSVLDAGADGRLEGTLAVVAAAILNGAHMVRVHDVAEARRAASMADALRRASV